MDTVTAQAGELPAPHRPRTRESRFRIASGSTGQLMAALQRRVVWHRRIAAALMLTTLVAIGGGIALIFYAGELAKQQRGTTVEALIERANDLSKKVDQIRSDAEGQIDAISVPPWQISNARNAVDKLETEIAGEKDPIKLKDLNSQLSRAQAELGDINAQQAKRSDRIKDIYAQRDSQIKPILDSEKEVNAQITGSSAILEWNSILIRVSAVLLIVFLVQTFISVFRYMTRLAAYYQARLDALDLTRDTEITIADLHELSSVFSPESYDFGKPPRTPTEQAIEIAKTIVASTRVTKEE